MTVRPTYHCQFKIVWPPKNGARRRHYYAHYCANRSKIIWMFKTGQSTNEKITSITEKSNQLFVWKLIELFKISFIVTFERLTAFSCQNFDKRYVKPLVESNLI
jgi:hypothetical protein